MSIIGWGIPVCQQLQLCEGMRIQETNAKQRQKQIRGGIFILQANVCILTWRFCTVPFVTVVMHFSPTSSSSIMI